MNRRAMHRGGIVLGGWGLWYSLLATSAVAVPSFISGNPRLPNPDQPYQMTSGRVDYGAALNFSVYNLEFRASDPSQLDIPTANMDGSVEFDSFFEVTYRMDVSFGLGPVFEVSGPGAAHIRGVAPPPSSFPLVHEFETELLSLDLEWVTPIFDAFSIRESPTMASTGVTRVEGGCYGVCPPVVFPMRISSFFDVYTEFSINGENWVPGDASIHLEQAPEPSSGLLVGLIIVGGMMWRGRLTGGGRRWTVHVGISS